jgi:hypothetical protein
VREWLEHAKNKTPELPSPGSSLRFANRIAILPNQSA